MPCGISLQYFVSFLRNVRLEGTIWVIKYKALTIAGNSERNRGGAERSTFFFHVPSLAKDNNDKAFPKP